MKLKGKQIADSSVKQEKLNVTTGSIIDNTHVTNADYVNTTSIDKVSSVTYSISNMNMAANNTLMFDEASLTPVLDFPISGIDVKVNNISVSVGDGKDCYFSGDGGVTKRVGNKGQKGDYLYWTSTRFELLPNDEIDFVYLITQKPYTLSSGGTVTLDQYYSELAIKYTGLTGTTATVIIDGVSFIVGNVADKFVWDIGGANEHTFTFVNENILQVVNTIDYTIWFDGTGSLLCSIKKGNNTYTIADLGILFGGSSQIEGDPFPTDTVTYGAYVGISKPTIINGDEYIFMAFQKGGYYLYNITTNYGKLLTATTTGIGGKHEVIGQIFPIYAASTGFPSVILSDGRIIFSDVYYTFVYNILSNVSAMVAIPSYTSRIILADDNEDYMYMVFYNSPAYISKYDLSTNLTTYTTIGNATNGDAPNSGKFYDLDAYNDFDDFACILSTWQLYLYNQITNTGKLLNATTTGIGGSHQVIGDSIPMNSCEKCCVVKDISGNNIIAVGIWHTNGGLWLYDELNNTGKLLSTTSTQLNGTHPVIGDPMPTNIANSMSVCDNIIFFGTPNGLWLYNIITNVGKLLTTTSTNVGGNYEVKGNALPNNNMADIFTNCVIDNNNRYWVSRIMNTLNLWIYIPKKLC